MQRTPSIRKTPANIGVAGAPHRGVAMAKGVWADKIEECYRRAADARRLSEYEARRYGPDHLAHEIMMQ
jgi:hypothetical protein